MTGPRLHHYICVLYNKDFAIDLQYFPKNTYPFLLMQTTNPIINIALDNNELNISERDAADFEEKIKKIVLKSSNRTKDYNALENDTLGIEDWSLLSHLGSVVVCQIKKSDKRSIDLSQWSDSYSNDDDLKYIKYIVDTLLEFKVIFLCNITRDYRQQQKLLNGCYTQFRRKYSGTCTPGL